MARCPPARPERRSGKGVLEGQAWRLDLAAVLQAVQVLADPSGIGSLDTLGDAVGVRVEQGLEALLQFDADRVVESL